MAASFSPRLDGTPVAPQEIVRVGIDIVSPEEIRIAVWAPDHATVQLVMDGVATPLQSQCNGYHAAVTAGRAGSRYGFRFAGDEHLYPDPASRSQPDGPHGLSEVIDPGAYIWHDKAWQGLDRSNHVLYEMHVGTYTPAGTWRAAIAHLGRLRDLGITTIQMMPIAEFDGTFGWGYDGVAWFAPSHLYGRPDDLRAFVDSAHAQGLGVVLDVVYNHLGPSGNYLGRFASQFLSTRYENEWGEPLNFEGETGRPMRALVRQNVEYWIQEFHLDGFRFDATQQIFDASPEHILRELAAAARAAASRPIVLTAENEPQESRVIRPSDRGGYGLDGMYNDDFHHAARVALTGVREAYYTDYEGSSRELVAAARWGFLFQGQFYSWQNQARGTPALDCDPEQFICFLENHDQVANSGSGQRLSTLTHPGDLRALTALLLLMPATPLLFEGQEWHSTAPWRYFAAHRGKLGRKVAAGRAEFMSQFTRLAPAAVSPPQPDPTAEATFTMCRLDHALTPGQERAWRLHRDLLALRQHDGVFGARPRRRPEGTVLNDRAFVLRFGHAADVRLLIVNLGSDLQLARVAEPLVAPPHGAAWRVHWSTENPEYGGSGLPPLDASRWLIPGHASVVLMPEANETDEPPHDDH